MAEQERWAAQMLPVQEHILQFQWGGVSGKVKTSEEGNALIEKYKNLYNMPEKMQKEFTDSFGQMIIDTYNQKVKAAENEMLKKTEKAFATKDESLYKSALSQYEAIKEKAAKERDEESAKYNKFIKVK